jgi:4-hydroxybenzoyl-CoA thioesterase
MNRARPEQPPAANLENDPVAVTIYHLTVRWGECDPAGIVFYPNFFSYFDQASWNVFAQVGITRPVMIERFGIVGIPLVDAQASFKWPCRFGDRLEIESHVSEWSTKSFTLQHRIRNGDREAVEGYEVRIWGSKHPEDPNRLKALPVPKEVVTAVNEGTILRE